MPQITIYLDAKTTQLVEAESRKAGMSKGRRIAKVIRQKCSDEWPQEVKDLAGAWSDFPDLDEIRSHNVPDCPREPW